MGNYLNTPPPPITIKENDKRGKKRKQIEDTSDEEEAEKIQETFLNTPKKKKLKSTSQYIYETLFLNGENNDVTIIALGKTWNLHRVYLCQSGYFHGMFTGGWKESQQQTIHIDIPDENIDHEALTIAFGSLYHDDVYIKPSHVVPVLAAATLLGLDGLIQQCAIIMKETMSSQSIGVYHSGALMYGITEVADSCLDWLLKHLMTSQTPTLLKQIGIKLMEDLIRSPDLFVVQVEMDIYTMLKKWMFLQEHPNWLGSVRDLATESDEFFKSLKDHNSEEFFARRMNGKRFEHVLRGLRLHHVINDSASLKVIEQDRIIPHDWLVPIFRKQWLQMLKIEQGADKGPTQNILGDFPGEALRVGRVLQRDGEYCWRWTGYNYGLDLLVSFTNRLVLLKRNTQGRTCVGSVSRCSKRNILYRITVASFGKDGQTKFLKTTGNKHLELGQDEEVVIFHIERSAQFPIHISANFLYYSPLPPTTGDNLTRDTLSCSSSGDADSAENGDDSDTSSES